MKPSQQQKSNTIKALELSWNRTLVIFMSIVSLITIGYGIGFYQKSHESNIEQLKAQQECNEKVQTIINQYRDKELERYQKSVSDLEGLVKELNGKEAKGGKN